jgi:hypothetical protein
MNGPTKIVGPRLTPLTGRKRTGVSKKSKKVLDNADDVIEGNLLATACAPMRGFTF